MFFLTLLFFQGQTFTSKHQKLTLTLDHPNWVMKQDLEYPYLFQGMNMRLRASLIASVSGSYQDTRYLKYNIYAIVKSFPRLRVLKISRKDSGDMKCISVTMKAELNGQQMFLNFLQVGQGWEYFLLLYNFPSENLQTAEQKIDKLLATLRFKERGPGQASPYSSDFEVLKFLEIENLFDINQKFLVETEKKDPDMDLLNRLIKQGADPNFYDGQATPLVLAGINHNLKLVRWLLDQGAEAHHQMIDDTIISVGMQAPLAQYLSQMAKDERAKYPVKPMKNITIMRPPPSSEEPDYTSEMFYSLEKANFNEFKACIDKGADLNAKDGRGNTVHQLVERYITDMKTLGADPTPYQAIQSYLNSQ